MRNLFFMVCVLLAVASLAQAETDRQPIGLVKVASGGANILREGQRVAAQPGKQLFQGDVLVTGADGKLGVILRDDTMLSFGPSSETRLDQFAFKPAEKKLGMVLKFARGTISYISGKVAKLAPGSVRLETPVATLGVRGTSLAVRVEP
jgi:hypothetical protein